MKDEASRCKVLIIDDDPDFANLVELILDRKCHDAVRIAASASEGLIAAEQVPPDFIIARIMMYEMSGYEVCRRLKMKPALKNVPVLLQAAMPPGRAYPEAQRVGAAGYLCAPFHHQALLAARDALLRGDTYYPSSPEEETS